MLYVLRNLTIALPDGFFEIVDLQILGLLGLYSVICGFVGSIKILGQCILFILQGFDVSQEFYNPCYRNRPLPDTKDYRRTLYWNPHLELDEKGCAHVTLWNNSTTSSITVSAEGITPTGKILTGISYPEDR